MERGVFIGGLMICGSFLLAASLNRSAMEETPPAPAAVAAPIRPAPLEAEAAQSPIDCAEVEPLPDASAVTETQQPVPDRCVDAD